MPKETKNSFSLIFIPNPRNINPHINPSALAASRLKNINKAITPVYVIPKIK